MSLGTRLKKVRLQKGLSQKDVAEVLNVTRQTVSKWENNASYPDLDNLVRLSEHYEISTDELLKGNTEIEKTVKENEMKVMEPEKDTKYLENTVEKDEGFILLLISLMGCLVTPLGLLIAPLVLKRNKATNTFYKLVIVASIVCILVNLFFTYGHLSNWSHWGVNTQVEFIGINK